MVMLQQMIVMFLMMAVGYLCYRKQILTEEVSRKVSAIVVNVANPCMILSSALTDQQMQGKELVQTLAIVVMMYAFCLLWHSFFRESCAYRRRVVEPMQR